jgi:hypothetical protein
MPAHEQAKLNKFKAGKAVLSHLKTNPRYY